VATMSQRTPRQEGFPRRNCDSDTIPSQLPTEAGLRGAEADLQEAIGSYLHVWWMVRRIARAHDYEDYPEHELVSGDERPTYAHVGRLMLFARDSEVKVDDLADSVKKLREELDHLAVMAEREAVSA
jgi:hypothetical protein